MANNIFKTVKVKRPKRNTFNLSHTNQLTCSFGKLIPFMCEETVPGDTWKVKAKTNTIFAALSCPVLTNMYATVHYFFVPFRLLNDEFEAFITNSAYAGSTAQEPYMELPCSAKASSNFYADKNHQWEHGSLADYLNFPTSEEISAANGGKLVSAYPFRAYQRIYDEYYRDENQIAQDEYSLRTTAGTISFGSPEWNALVRIKKRAWAKDYFTSALPWTQRGPEQSVPVTGLGSLASDSISFDASRAGSSTLYDVIQNEDGTRRQLRNALPTDFPSNMRILQENDANTSPVGGAMVDNSKHLKISNKTVAVNGMSFTINEFRRANAIQRWFERNARAGSRYVESLLSHFGVISSDARIQRPEFLGGNTTKVSVSDVIQTSSSDSVTPQGNRSGLAYSFQDAGFTRTFEERGLIIGIFSLTPQGSYAEGLRRVYAKTDFLDYYFPEFAHLGEQEVSNYELALRSDVPGRIDEPFGYTPRYAQYKFIPSTIHGDFKNYEGLGDWTLARHYAEGVQPTLSKSFIEVDAKNQDLDRIFAVQEEASLDQIMVNFDIMVKARRPMPYLPEPSL